MVKDIISKCDYEEVTRAQVRQGKQYYQLNIKLQEIDERYIVLTEIYDHEPTQADRDTLYSTYLELCKKVKVTEIAHHNKSKEVDGFFVNGEHAWLGKDERSALERILRIQSNKGVKTYSLYLNGKRYDVDVQSAFGMLDNLEVYAMECLKRTEEHKIAVMALNDIVEVENYDCTQGYPEHLQFSL